MIKRINFFILIFFFALNSHLSALDKTRIEDLDKFRSKIEELNWKNLDNPKTFFHKINKANVELHIIESEIFLEDYNDINQFNYWAWGLPAEKDVILFIRGLGYSIYVHYVESGYVKIDDWKKIKSEDLLSQLKETAKFNKKILKEQGLTYVNDIKWIYKPTFDEKNKIVFYSYEVFWSDGEKSMENKSIVLGRKGHLENAYVVVFDKDTNLLETAEYSKEFGESVIFEEGYRYSNYKSGDRVAAVGIGGLVAGSLGVKALAKAGAFAKFLPLLAKFWWIILAPILLLLSFAGKKTRKEKKKR